MKETVADVYFDHHPDTRALRIATAAAFGIPVTAVIEGDALASSIATAYANPLIRAIWLRDEAQTGEFPWLFTLALEPMPHQSNESTIDARLAAIIGALGQAAVLPRAFGDLLLLGPDGSTKLVTRDEDVAEGIALLQEDRETLARAYAAQRAAI